MSFGLNWMFFSDTFAAPPPDPPLPPDWVLELPELLEPPPLSSSPPQAARPRARQANRSAISFVMARRVDTRATPSGRAGDSPPGPRPPSARRTARPR